MIATDLISIPNAPVISGLVFRHFRGHDDFPGMTAALAVSEAADGVERIVSVEAITNMYSHLTNCDLSQDLLIPEVNGEIVGYSRIEWWQNDAGERIYSHFVFLKPQWRRKRIGTAMLGWIQERIRQIAATHSNDGPRFFETFASDLAPGADTLLRKDGYTTIRHFFRMVRPTLDNIPDFPLPAGLEVRPVKPEHYRAIWDANNEAFRDHWGYAEATEADYEGWLKDPVTFTPESWKIAWDVETNQVAGQVKSFINHDENKHFNRKRGWTEFISVGRLWRRRGLARALIALSLHELKARGMTEAALGVDTQNLSGALRVYEDCGFRPVMRSTTYRKPLE